MESAAYNSMKGKIAFGENAGSYVTRLGMGFGYAEEVPKFKSKLCYSPHSFSMNSDKSSFCFFDSIKMAPPIKEPPHVYHAGGFFTCTNFGAHFRALRFF